MCGIAGLVSKEQQPSAALLSAMTDAIRRRGPDSTGHFIEGNVALGMRRLSIIDLKGGDQPIYNEDKSVVVVCNGEIYNYKQLTSELKHDGHTFSTSSDIEVIVHLYEKYGSDFVSHLDGMFAIALLDRPRKKLILARDRLGIKPLFFAELAGDYVFASEIKSIMEHPDAQKDIDYQALDEYLCYGYIPGPRSIYKQIRKVEPGTVIQLNDGSSPKVSRFWNLPLPSDLKKSDNVWQSECERLLLNSIESHMVSDVKVGAFLSGGIDSSLVVAMASSLQKSSIDTYTIVFDSKHSNINNETKSARALAKMYKANYNEIVVQPSFDDICDELVDAFDEPFADDSVIPSYYVCRETGNHRKVALSGLGGDELFGGYTRHLGLLFGKIYQRLPKSINRYLVKPLVNRIPDFESTPHFLDRARRFVRASELDEAHRYHDSLSSLPASERMTLYSEATRKKLNPSTSASVILDSDHWSTDLSTVEKALRVDIDTYLVDDVLCLTDRLSMWHSLEVRVPFLDHHLVEFVSGIPQHLKIRGVKQKYLLRRIAESWLPRSIMKQPKQGFESPMSMWLRGPLLAHLKDSLSPTKIDRQGIFCSEAISKLIHEHEHGTRTNNKILFALLMFQHWHTRNF